MSQWEESKRLNGRIEALKKKLHGKGEEVVEVQREADKHRLHAEKLQVCGGWGKSAERKCGVKCGKGESVGRGKCWRGKRDRPNVPLPCSACH